MKIVEIWQNPDRTNYKILVEDGLILKDEYLVFHGKTEGFYIVQLSGDKSMDKLMEIKKFIEEFFKTINSESITVNP